MHIDRKTLELKNLVTKEEHRGKGYAKKLLKSYDEEIIDGDLHCIDMYYYSKDLKKVMKYN